MIASTISLAIREIRKNLFRAVLTILGVVIGVAAVVAIVTIGDGAAAQITSNFDRIGATTVIVSPGMQRGGPPRPGMGALGRPFTQEDVAELSALDLVRDVAAVQPVPAYVSSEVTQQPTLVTATTPAYFRINQLTVAAGVGLEDLVVEEGEPQPLIVGQRAARELFDPEWAQQRLERRRGPGGPLRRNVDEPEPIDPELVLDQELDLSGTPFRVVGLLDWVDAGPFGFNHNGALIVPLAAATDGSEDEAEIRTMLIAVTDVDQMDEARDQIRSMLRERRGLTEGQRSDFSIRGIDQIVEMIEATTGTVTTVIGLIAAISLLVGGIGIMNVMLVTVTERTREVGLRIAIGAEPGDVMLQFLVEAAMLTAFGGVVGIALGLAGGAVAAQVVGIPFTPNLAITAGVFLFSVLIGVVFGFLPARRAARINPIDALRHE